MGLKPPRDPPTKWRGKAERIKPAGGGAAGSTGSVFTSFGFGWKGSIAADRGDRSGVRGMLTGRLAGWMGCTGRGGGDGSCDRKD